MKKTKISVISKNTPQKTRNAEEHFDPYHTGRTRNRKTLDYDSANVRHRRQYDSHSLSKFDEIFNLKTQNANLKHENIKLLKKLEQANNRVLAIHNEMKSSSLLRRINDL